MAKARQIPGDHRGFLLVAWGLTCVFGLTVFLVVTGLFPLPARVSPIVMMGAFAVVAWIDWASLNQRLNARWAGIIKWTVIGAMFVLVNLSLLRILPP
jgi:hypothetical protein